MENKKIFEEMNRCYVALALRGKVKGCRRIEVSRESGLTIVRFFGAKNLLEERCFELNDEAHARIKRVYRNNEKIQFIEEEVLV